MTFAVLLLGAVLQHYDIRPDALPAPNATASANNGPRVVAKPADASLLLPAGFSIAPYATGLQQPRMMILAPNGDVIVSEPAFGRITVLRDTNNDGEADARFTFASNLTQPFGLALHGGYLYVGLLDAVVRYPYTNGQTAATRAPERLTDLPTGGHISRNIIFNREGTKMYIAVGSSGNVNVESDPSRAAISEMNPDGTGRRVYASGLRNPSGMAIEPVTGALWTAVNERDGLGDDLVPDYITRVQDGGFYGWPYAYIGQHLQPGFSGRPDLVAASIVPDVLLQSHSASLGIAFYDGNMFPSEYYGDAFVALHGSWNRARRTGYKVVRVKMQNGVPVGGYDDFVIGWSPDESSGDVWGRPVGLLVLGDGSLLVSDDGAGTIWRVSYRRPARRRAVRP